VRLGAQAAGVGRQQTRDADQNLGKLLARKNSAMSSSLKSVTIGPASMLMARSAGDPAGRKVGCRVPTRARTGRAAVRQIRSSGGLIMKYRIGALRNPSLGRKLSNSPSGRAQLTSARS
jgi:hypothetical protein